jgi:hypothetical protein
MGFNMLLAQISVSVRVPGGQPSDGLLPHTGLGLVVLVAVAVALIAVGWVVARVAGRKTEVKG